MGETRLGKKLSLQIVAYLPHIRKLALKLSFFRNPLSSNFPTTFLVHFSGWRPSRNGNMNCCCPHKNPRFFARKCEKNNGTFGWCAYGWVNPFFSSRRIKQEHATRATNSNSFLFTPKEADQRKIRRILMVWHHNFPWPRDRRQIPSRDDVNQLDPGSNDIVFEAGRFIWKPDW